MDISPLHKYNLFDLLSIPIKLMLSNYNDLQGNQEGSQHYIINKFNQEGFYTFQKCPELKGGQITFSEEHHFGW